MKCLIANGLYILNLLLCVLVPLAIQFSGTTFECICLDLVLSPCFRGFDDLLLGYGAFDGGDVKYELNDIGDGLSLIENQVLIPHC